MPQVSVENNNRMSLRVVAAEKSMLMRAAALQHTNLTEFVMRAAIALAHKIIDQNDKIKLGERDSLHVLDLLENPPAPNKKLLAAARALSKND